eukprot:Skav214563  [mRNA]  locus=scaffold2080:23488:24620:- [translate_table: standard]
MKLFLCKACLCKSAIYTKVHKNMQKFASGQAGLFTSPPNVDAPENTKNKRSSRNWIVKAVHALRSQY